MGSHLHLALREIPPNSIGSTSCDRIRRAERRRDPVCPLPTLASSGARVFVELRRPATVSVFPPALLSQSLPL